MDVGRPRRGLDLVGGGVGLAEANVLADGGIEEIVVLLDDGDAAPGQFHHPRSENRTHDHVVFQMSSGASIVFNDPRRFGYMKIIARRALEDELVKGLGPEPLGNEFDAGCWRSPAPARRPA
jgi:hypothetical protein